MRKWISAALVGVIIECVACTFNGSEEPSSFDIPTVEIVISQENLTQVYLGGGEQSPTSARIKKGGETLRGYLSVSGQASLTYPKKSFTFERIGTTDSVKLSAQSQDQSYLRTVLFRRFLVFLEIETPEVEPVALLINGQYHGVYLWIERVTPEFYRKRGLDPARLYRAKLLKADFNEGMARDPRYGLESEMGTFDVEEIRALATWANSPPSSESMDKLSRIIDPKLMAQYFAAQLFLQNCDGFNNNFYLVSLNQDRRLRFTPWDWEVSHSERCSLQDMLDKSKVATQLASYPETREMMLATLRRLRAEFPPERVRKLLEEDYARIASAHAMDPYRAESANLEQDRESLLTSYSKWASEIEERIGSRFR